MALGKRVALALALVSVALVSGARADPPMHVVQPGETLGAIALRHGVGLEMLRRWNRLPGDRILPGQRLLVGATAAVTDDADAAEPETLRYVVVPGDTLGCIARRHGVSLETLRAANPDLSGLPVGVELAIPGGVDPRAAHAPLTAHVAIEGETLERIAQRYGVSRETLHAANPELELEVLPAGTEVAVPAPPPRVYEVRPGDTLGTVARRHGISLSALRERNADLRLVPLPVGLTLAIGPSRAPSLSVGSASCGLVVGSVPLGTHPAYILRDPSRSHATRSTVDRIRRAFTAVRRAHPRAPRVRVHDLGLEGGGPIDDHRSHQSGRDVDITYYQRRGCGPGGCPMRRVSPAELNSRLQWALFSHWIERGEVEVIFVDYALQAPLYQEARRRGRSEAELARIFQYPRGRWSRDAVIRHFPNHRDHFHARFACQPSEPDCR